MHNVEPLTIAEREELYDKFYDAMNVSLSALSANAIDLLAKAALRGINEEIERLIALNEQKP